MSDLMPDLHDEPIEATTATPAPQSQTRTSAPEATSPAPTEAVAAAAAPDAAAAPAVKGDAPVDHFAAVGKMMDSTALDALAARVIANGGVDGVTFAPNDGGPTAEHADLGSHASAIQSELQSLADSFVEAQGVNVADFHKYVRAQGSAVLNSTGLVLFHSRSPDTALRALVQEFKRTSAFRRSR